MPGIRLTSTFLSPHFPASIESAMLFKLLRALVISVFAVLAVVALFIAWWIALFLIFALVAGFWLKRIFGSGQGRDAVRRQSAQDGQPVVIEGEFAVESDRPRSAEPLDPPRGPASH